MKGSLGHFALHTFSAERYVFRKEDSLAPFCGGTRLVRLGNRALELWSFGGECLGKARVKMRMGSDGTIVLFALHRRSWDNLGSGF